MANENNNRENAPMNQVVDYLRKMEQDGCTISDLIATLEDLPKHGESSSATANAQAWERVSLKMRISNILIELGMPHHIRGYRYTKAAITLVYEDPNVLNSITKVFYPTVAQKFGTTWECVERAIRHAIESVWKRCDTDVLKKYFGNIVGSDKNKPTNSEFIAMLAEYLRLHG